MHRCNSTLLFKDGPADTKEVASVDPGEPNDVLRKVAAA